MNRTYKSILSLSLVGTSSLILTSLLRAFIWFRFHDFGNNSEQPILFHIVKIIGVLLFLTSLLIPLKEIKSSFLKIGLITFVVMCITNLLLGFKYSYNFANANQADFSIFFTTWILCLVNIAMIVKSIFSQSTFKNTLLTLTSSVLISIATYMVITVLPFMEIGELLALVLVCGISTVGIFLLLKPKEKTDNMV